MAHSNRILFYAPLRGVFTPQGGTEVLVGNRSLAYYVFVFCRFIGPGKARDEMARAKLSYKL